MRKFSIPTLLVASSLAYAQRDATVPDPDPEVERKSFQVADGFEVNLFASDPRLAKPTQMNFDPQGRLWVTSSEVYPQIQPGQVADDKVLILEDTDGDGRADRTTVFADGLLIPTGVAPGDGGAYVADSTDLVHFSDPDPLTGKARKKRIVLSGFGTEDTHHIIHTFQWMPDSALYFNQSVYIHSHVETPTGVRRLNAGGIWRFRPETSDLEVFARGWWNSWGHKWDRWGATFATDGAGGEGINYVVPGAYYAAAQGSPRILPGLNPGSPKFCGLEVLSGRHLPDDYQGNFVTNDFRGHRVCRFVVEPDGAGFISKEKPELLKSDHPAFRPIDVAMGPDGAIYVADWYNPIIQHGEVDFRDPRRDKTHGRIWRISATGRKLVEKPQLVSASLNELLDQLAAPEQWTRTQAKRVIHERLMRSTAAECKSNDMIELNGWLSRLLIGETDNHLLLLEALWVVDGINGKVNEELIDRVLGCRNPEARATACRIAGHWANRGDFDASSRLAARVNDDNARVRLEAVRALARVGTTAAAAAATKVLDKPMDQWLDYALWLTLRETAAAWLPEVRIGKLDFSGDPNKLIFALKAAGTEDIAKPLIALLDRSRLEPAPTAEVLVAIAEVGGPVELAYAVTRGSQLDGNFRDRVFAAVAEQAELRKVAQPAVDVNDKLQAALSTGRGQTFRAAARLAGAWNITALQPNLERIVISRDTPVEDYRAACDGLILLGGSPAIKLLTNQASTVADVQMRRAMICALVQADLPGAAKLAANDLVMSRTDDNLKEFISTFVRHKDGSTELARALTGKTIPSDAAKVGVQVARAAGHPNQSLINAFNAAGGLSSQKRDWSKADIDRLAADAMERGNPANGERIYRRADLACQKCHAIAGAGGVVGPDLSSLGGSAQPDYIVESLLLPNAKIKEGYHTQVITTVSGKVITGIKVRESTTEVVVRDAEDRESVTLIADIDERKDGKSLMPDGTTDPLTNQELMDLVRFLATLGKVGGGYEPTPGRVVRRWQTVQAGRELMTLTNRQRVSAVANPAADIPWGSVYSLVSGDLPLEDLTKFKPHRDQPACMAVRFQLEVTSGGAVKLLLNNPAGISAWLDGAPIDVANEITVDVLPGVRTVTLVIQQSASQPEPRTDPIRIELVDVPGSTARAQLIGGK